MIRVCTVCINNAVQCLPKCPLKKVKFVMIIFLSALSTISPSVTSAMVGDMNAAAVLVMVAGYVEMSRVSN